MIKKGKEKGKWNKKDIEKIKEKGRKEREKETKEEERTNQTKGIQKGNAVINLMKCRLGFKLSFGLLQKSKGNKRKMEGKTKKRKQRNTQFKLK